ncbi:MAG: alpha/beta fold hydrolase, partial [Acidimicrobiia bacterium]
MSTDRRRLRRRRRRCRCAGAAVVLVAVLLSSCSSGSAGGDDTASTVSAPPVSGFVQGADGVLLEYRDWGGEGPPIVLLTGLGDSAAVFDDLAPRLTAGHRVVGLTRRGFAPSTVTADGYDVPTRVADDIAALDGLGIERALLVGHSISGDVGEGGQPVGLGLHPRLGHVVAHRGDAFGMIAGRRLSPVEVDEPI